MSLKPPKKSDLDKTWMKARRDKPKKIQPEYHLIITEGYLLRHFLILRLIRNLQKNWLGIRKCG